MKTVSMVACVALIAVCGTASGENWVGWEGLWHQNSSAVDIPLSPSTHEVKWDRRFTPSWQTGQNTTGTTYTGHFHSRNIAYYYGHIALVATTHSTYTGGRQDYGHVAIVDAKDGSVVNCISTKQWFGSMWDIADACETPPGQQVVTWDPETGILHLTTGGDHPSHRSYLPLANADSYDSGTGVPVAGVGAWAAFDAVHPNFVSSRGTYDFGSGPIPVIRLWEDSVSSGSPPLQSDEWDSGTIGPSSHAANRTAFVDLQPGSPYMATSNGSGHAKGCGAYLTNKFTGRAANRVDQYNMVYDTGWPIWKRMNGQLVRGDMVYHFGPYDPALSATANVNAVRGLSLIGLRYADSDLRENDGYTGPGSAETATPSVVFDYKVESDASDGSGISWDQGDATSQNLAWFAVEGGVWATWKPNQARAVELVHATASALNRYDLSVCSDMQVTDINPDIAYADLGVAGRYVVYYVAPGQSATNRHWTLTVFDVDAGAVKWTYQIRSGDSGNFTTIPASSQSGYGYRSRMVVAGRHALIAWVDTSGTNVALRILPIDITQAAAPSSAPTTLDYELASPTVPSASYGASRMMDLAVVNGMVYALVTEDDVQSFGYFSTNGLIVAQRVIAIGATDLSSIDVDLVATPSSGAAKVVAVLDGSGSTTTAPGGIVSYEWDFDWDHISFDVDATGTTVSRVFDTVGSHTVGLRVTDATGRSEIRAATVTVTPDEAAEQSATFAVITQQGYNTNGTTRLRVSGSYSNGNYGIGSDHARGYVSYQAVTLDPSYDLVAARLHFNCSRTNNSNKTTVHRLKPTDSAPTDWASISALTGYDQNAGTTTVCEPLDTRSLSATGPFFFDVTDAVAAWLGRSPYGSAETQRGFLLVVDRNSTAGTLVGGTGPFYTGEDASFQWDWDSTSLEVIYLDPSASTPTVISDVRPGAAASESYGSASPLTILWGSTGPVDFVDIHYSATSSGGPWTAIAASAPNTGTYSWATPAVGGTVWIRVSLAGDTTVNAVSANSFEVAPAGPTYTLSGTVTLSGDLTDAAGVTLRLMSGATLVDSEVLVSGGAYSFTGLPAGTYTYELVRTNYSFAITTPASGAVTVSADATQNVSATVTQTGGFTLSGTVTLSGDLTDANGATLRLMSGAVIVKSVVLDSSGTYSFTAIDSGTYTIQIARTGYSFTITAPVSGEVAVTANATQDVSATATKNQSPSSGGGCVFGSSTDGTGMMQGLLIVLGLALCIRMRIARG